MKEREAGKRVKEPMWHRQAVFPPGRKKVDFSSQTESGAQRL
jgi:hypothetical protein